MASGQLLRYQGPALDTLFWDASQLSPASVGSAQLRFHSSRSATLNYVLDGIPGRLELTPFERLADPNYSGIWYDPARIGQGVQLVQHASRLAGAWYLYDSNGRAYWMTFTGTLSDNRLDTELLAFSGPAFADPDGWVVDQVESRSGGRVRVELLDPELVIFDYTLSGQGEPQRLNLVPFTRP